MQLAEEKEALSSNTYRCVELKRHRELRPDDPGDTLFRLCESQLFRTSAELGRRLRSVRYAIQPQLVERFEARRQQLSAELRAPQHPVLAWHGTDASVVDLIMKGNFDLAKVRFVCCLQSALPR